MKVRKRAVVRRTLVLLCLVAVVFPALGCAGKTAATEPSGQTPDGPATSGVFAGQEFPEELGAVMGRTETSAGECSLWYVTRHGDVHLDLAANYVVAAAEHSDSVVYSDLDTGGLYLWRPGLPSPDDITNLGLGSPTGDSVLGDAMAVSPDGRRLALVRYERAVGSTGEAEDEVTVAHGFILDLDSGESQRWEWLERAASGDEVTALQWNAFSSSVYVSFGPGGGCQGERSYRYDRDTGESVELKGLAAVLEVGPHGEVVGLGAAESASDLDYPAGSQQGLLPLVLWADDELVRIPRDPGLLSWDSAWMSDDGKTIVVRGSHADGGEQRPCLEVLCLGDAGWEVGRVYDGGGSVEVVYGIAFEPGTGTFYFQGGTPPSTTGKGSTDMRLFGMDAVTGQVSRYMSLPGAETGRYLQVLSVVGLDDRGGEGSKGR